MIEPKSEVMPMPHRLQEQHGTGHSPKKPKKRQKSNLISKISCHHPVLKTGPKNKQKDTRNKLLTWKIWSRTPQGRVLISFESFLKNKEPLQTTAAVENLKVPRSVRSTVLDEDILSVQLQKSLKTLKPISTAITTSESDSALLSDVP
jgi:hypothetical protein